MRKLWKRFVNVFRTEESIVNEILSEQAPTQKRRKALTLISKNEFEEMRAREINTTEEEIEDLIRWLKSTKTICKTRRELLCRIRQERLPIIDSKLEVDESFSRILQSTK